MENFWLTVAESCRYMRCSETFLKEIIAEKKVPVAIVENRALLNRTQIDNYLLSLQSPVNIEELPPDQIPQEDKIGGVVVETYPPPTRRDYKSEITRFWEDENKGFTVLNRTVGSSARHHNKPRIWVYPKKLQIAPKGKGNELFKTLRDILMESFSDIRNEATVFFTSPDFSWEKCTTFIEDAKRICEEHN